jgi:hypothetical protein
MSGFPYPDSESYPFDEAHLNYLREYNTRTIPAVSEQWILGNISLFIMLSGLIIAGLISALILMKARVARQNGQFAPK